MTIGVFASYGHGIMCGLGVQLAWGIKALSVPDHLGLDSTLR